MFIRRISPLLLAALALAGCGKRAPATPTSPLTVEEWKAMPVDRKYTAESFERLKEGDPKLQTEEGWMWFGRTTLYPARQRDFPRGAR